MTNQLGHAIRWEVDFQRRKGPDRLWTDRCEWYIRQVYPNPDKTVDEILAIGRLRDLVRDALKKREG